MKILKELRDLIPPLSEDEFLGLEKSIKDEGCRDALIVWGDDEILVDGHNRYKICSENKISFKVIKKDFSNVVDVKLWIINNQKSRRNLTEGWKYELERSKKFLLLLKGKQKQLKTLKQGDKIPDLSKIDKTDKHDTRLELARGLNWSTGKVAMADKVWKEAPKEKIEEIKSGIKTINEVYAELKKEDRKEKIELQKKELKNLKPIEGKFNLIVVDPPWQFAGEYDPVSFRGAGDYPTMSIEEIKAINIPADDDCVLWLWGVDAFLKETLEIINGWGFERKATLIWDKQKMGLGKWLRNQHEYCFLCIKGKPKFFGENFRSVLSIARTKHSEKPEEFYNLVEKASPYLKKLDYFARKKRDGWDVFGDEVK